MDGWSINMNHHLWQVKSGNEDLIVATLITLKDSMATKRFDKELHDTYDKFGRDIVKSYVSSFWGMEARDNPNRYGVDLHLYKDDLLVGYAEVEVRLSWKTVEFPYEDLNVPNRKKKLLTQDMLTYFFSVNKDGTALFHCEAAAVLASEVKESRNKYVYQGELFYKVPLDRLSYVVLPTACEATSS